MDATAINYTMLAIVCAFGGPLVNKLGVKWSLVIGAATFPIRGASYYTNSKYGNQWIGLYTVVLLNMGVYIWSIVMQVRFDKHNPGAIDWEEQLYPSAFLPYFFVQTTGPLSQSYMYWLISSFATDAQSLGPMIVLTNDVPDRIPADVLAEEQQAAIEGKKVDPHTLPSV
ncbi:hypothetical protein SLS63_008227 [Diaporthe eres]|uniref:Uncharacterized protein n=1 Tax=Diaporthe eres TaxID=83184 RepID=A0ABR1P353_DIAER